MPDRIASAAVAALAIAAALPAAAQDAALIIGNENYRAGADVAAAGDGLDATEPLEHAGFIVRRGAATSATTRCRPCWRATTTTRRHPATA